MIKDWKLKEIALKNYIVNILLIKVCFARVFSEESYFLRKQLISQIIISSVQKWYNM